MDKFNFYLVLLERTKDEFARALENNDIRISDDGKGRWINNIFVEQSRRSIKYQEVYLKAYDTFIESKRSLAYYFGIYNTEQQHQSLGKQMLNSIYTQLPDKMAT